MICTLGPEGKRARRDGNNGRDVRPDALLSWLTKQVEPYSEVGVKPVVDMTTSFQVTATRWNVTTGIIHTNHRVIWGR